MFRFQDFSFPFPPQKLMKLKKTQKPKAKDGPKNITLIVKLEKKVVGVLPAE